MTLFQHSALWVFILRARMSPQKKSGETKARVEGTGRGGAGRGGAGRAHVGMIGFLAWHSRVAVVEWQEARRSVC